jgi:AIPR protein
VAEQRDHDSCLRGRPCWQDAYSRKLANRKWPTNLNRDISTIARERHVLVRVLKPNSESSRDRIIRATNSQTFIDAASLRATDEIHRKIEEWFKVHQLYYERRKNFYKNAGMPRDRIVSIPVLAQAVMAVVLHKPDVARARPSSLLKRDDDYLKVFNPDYSLQLYLNTALILQRVDRFLSDQPLPTMARYNRKFHSLHGYPSVCSYL